MSYEKCDRCGQVISDPDNQVVQIIGYQADNEDWSVCPVCVEMLRLFMDGHDVVDRQIAEKKAYGEVKTYID